jgi:chaperonin GroES
MAKVKPLGDRALVKPVEEDEQVKGGIIIPDTAKEKPQRGEIVAVGDGKPDDSGNRIPLSVAAGDTVLYRYSEYSSTEVRLDDEDYLIIPEGDILAIIA